MEVKEHSAQVISGTVTVMWDSGDDERHLLLNIEPDQIDWPHTFEIEGDLRDQVVDTISEGDRVEISYRPIEHEVVDPDSGPSEIYRTEIISARLIE